MITEGEEQKHLKWGSNWGEMVSIQTSFCEGHFKGYSVSPQQMRQNQILCGSVASVGQGYKIEENGLIPDALRHQIYKIGERRLRRILTNNLSFLNHADIFNS